MSRMTIFHHADNEAGHVMAVINEADCHIFYGLGFVQSADHVEPISPSDEVVALRAENDVLKQQLAAAQVKTDAPTTDTGGAPDSKRVKKNSEA